VPGGGRAGFHVCVSQVLLGFKGEGEKQEETGRGTQCKVGT
jgi:hypothetical protein